MNQNEQSIDTAARRRTRRVIIQLLYQWHLTDESLNTLIEQFMPELESKSSDKDYFERVIHEMFPLIPEIDQYVAPYLSRDFEELTMVEKAVLRLATFELMHCLDVPYKAVINEALELNKRYGTKDGHKFVNGVLDKIASIIREAEIGKV